MATTFNPQSSSVRDTTIVDFLKMRVADIDIKEVPGVGPALAAKLQEDGVETAAQLLGVYLSFVSNNASTEDVCNKFFAYLKGFKSGANCHSPTFAIANYADEHGLFTYDV